MSSLEEQREVLSRVAAALARRRLAPLAIFALESIRPLSFLASQALIVIAPLVQVLVSPRDYELFQEALEDRSNVDWLISELERQMSMAHGEAVGTGSKPRAAGDNTVNGQQHR